MAGAAFWLAVAACLIAAAWFKSRGEAQKHETVRRIIDKTGTYDPDQIRLLLSAPIADPTRFTTGDGYIALRVIGSIAMFVAVGVAIFFLIRLTGGGLSHDEGVTGLASAVVVAFAGAGVFFASRFADPPARLSSTRS